ncbi:response regulator transcription factor [Paenibacillus validus]|uniref:response regulator transcription factor n=1 Tax=Paenibacillus validus TaxID=44253 RepID=UPI000FD96B9A|nr:response regulator transcription factor [Paenibacillus validus]MED4601278.1 response regulator transcription factor [Paenibacillus validus]MED4605941.1 response regulator transcription factor [Paenibacillus validus]
MLRAMIVDDEELSVKWLKKILSESGDVEICQAFFSPLEAYEYVKTNKIDIAFLDISMPEINGISLSSLLLDLDATLDVVFVTAHDNYAIQAFEVSALDYLMKPVTAQRLAKTLDKVRRNNRSGTAGSSMEALRRDQDQAPDTELSLKEILTEQETRILRLIAKGLSNKEIADRLHITGETVKSHIKNVYRKLGINNRVQALQRAEQLKIR